MKIFKALYFFSGLLLVGGCTNVKLALYDNQKRQEVAIESKKAFSNSEAGKEIALKNSIVETARKYLGTGYKYGSTDPKKGFDCSGLVCFVAKKHNIDLPRSSGSMAASAPHIPWKKASPGDLVFFGERGSINHVAIVEKNKGDELWVIHSTNQRGVFYENVLVSAYWKKRILFAVDFSTLHPKPKDVKS
jgi:cell wall-associated NlpC family hydrolase